MPGSISYTLKEPVADVTADAPPIKALSVRRPTAGDLRVTDGAKGEVGQAIALLSQVTGTTPDVINRLFLEDFQALNEIMENGWSETPAQ